MLPRLLILGLLLAVPLAHAADDDLEKITFMVPRGDPEAGREAFIALSCTACHTVAGERDLPEPTARVPIVPVLNSVQARLSPGKLASSIVAPSHKISDEVQLQTEGDLSPMGDFSRAMTVRQLVDLVAYVRSLDRASDR